jgi:hypothetical protein
MSAWTKLGPALSLALVLALIAGGTSAQAQMAAAKPVTVVELFTS